MLFFWGVRLVFVLVLCGRLFGLGLYLALVAVSFWLGGSWPVRFWCGAVGGVAGGVFDADGWFILMWLVLF